MFWRVNAGLGLLYVAVFCASSSVVRSHLLPATSYHTIHVQAVGRYVFAGNPANPREIPLIRRPTFMLFGLYCMTLLQLVWAART